jgi:hypothetical protein
VPADNAVGLQKALAIDAILSAEDEHAPLLLQGIKTAIEGEKQRLASKRKREDEVEQWAKERRVEEALVARRQREVDALCLPFMVTVDGSGVRLSLTKEASKAKEFSVLYNRTQRLFEWISEEFDIHDAWDDYLRFELDINDDGFAGKVEHLRKMDAKLAGVLIPSSTRK